MCKPNIIINSAASFGSENKKFSEIDIKKFYSIFNTNVFSENNVNGGSYRIYAKKLKSGSIDYPEKASKLLHNSFKTASKP